MKKKERYGLMASAHTITSPLKNVCLNGQVPQFQDLTKIIYNLKSVGQNNSNWGQS